MELRTKLETLNNKPKYRRILTNREIEFLCLVSLGYKNNIIANNLFVAKSTVKKTLENIFKKLKARDRANAVAIAFMHNLITKELLTEFEKTYSLK